MALVPCQVLRVAILLSYCSLLCNFQALEVSSFRTYGGKWKFLTFINLVIQTAFFGICVLTDLSSLLTRGSGNQEQERQLKKLISLRDWMLAIFAFPIGVFVVVMFWTIYAYDRELVYPKLLDNFVPGWMNHGMDILAYLILGSLCGLYRLCQFSGVERVWLVSLLVTFTAIWARTCVCPLAPPWLGLSAHNGFAVHINPDEDITPCISQQEKWTRHHMHRLCCLYIMAMLNASFREASPCSNKEIRLCWVHHVTGMWVYPVLEHLGLGARIVFFGSGIILVSFIYLLGEVLNSYIWDTQKSMEEEKEKPKLE